jgi:16S rRNA (adenine1518-N6/adenine1519-N6)-dimethyltransferase
MVGPRKHLSILGLAPSRARGQNFLKDPNIAGKIADWVVNLAQIEPAAGPAIGGPRIATTTPGELERRGLEVVEIGPGLGALTGQILKRGLPLTAVELDRGLAEALRLWPEALDQRLRVVSQDILTVDLGRDFGPKPTLVCGNIPYNLSTPILFWFMDQAPIAQIGLFTLQKEMAQRLAAQAGSRDYGRLTVAVSLWYEIQAVLNIPPSAFSPKPKVDSALVYLRLKTDPPSASWRASVGRLTRAAFAARRKTIINNLTAQYGRPKAEEALSSLSLEPTLRAERLEPQVLAELARILEPLEEPETTRDPD